MKKYQLKEISTNRVIGNFDSKSDAVDEMAQIIEDTNDELDTDDEEYLTPFDFSCIEIEINEEIADYEAAKRFIGLAPNSKTSISAINPKHIKALIALNTLFTIAEAWNKQDNFVPDFSNRNQYKYFPWFNYDEEAAGFVCANAHYAAASTYAAVGSRLCFKDSNRARQFGTQFIDLWNDFLLFR